MTESRPAKRAAFEPAERLLRPTGYNPGMRRPASTVAGALLVLLRVLVGIGWLVEVALNWDSLTKQAQTTATVDAQLASAALAVIVGFAAVLVIADVVLAAFIYRGHNWPRVIVMVISVISISSAFVAWWAENRAIGVKTSLFSTALDVLVLLALSSRSAAAYARRNERR